MRKRKVMGKILRIAVVFLMIGAILGGLLGGAGIAVAAEEYYATREEAVSHVPVHVAPKDCFVWKDGPDPAKPWRVIPGTGCAHWVAHELGLGIDSPWQKWERGEIEPPLPPVAWRVCYGGFYIRVADVIRGRTEVEIKDAKVGDIWTNDDLTHTGIVRQVGSGEVLVEHDSSVEGGVVQTWFSRGKCWHRSRLYAGSSNPGVVYRYVGDKNWEPISPTSELPPEDIVAESISIESPHPYPNNYNNTWTEVRPGAAAIRVHFNYIQTEGYYDHVYIRDSDGNIINDYSGYYADVWSNWVFGNTIKIQLVSDYSVMDDGFVIDRLEWGTTRPGMPLGYAVLCLVDYEGQLYAGTMSTSDPRSGIGRVYRYDGGTSWTLVGDNLDNQVSSLAVYQGELYAGTAWNGMRLYKYTPGTTNCGIGNWTRKVDYAGWDGTRSLHVSHDYFLMGGIGLDYIGHWDGSTFHQDQTEPTGSCIYDFEDYGDNIYAVAYEGRMWQSSDVINWDVVLDYYEPDYPNIWELETFQGLLYMAYNNGELRATDGIDLRGMLKCTASDGIISMEADGVNLYFGTGGEAGAYYGSETEGIATIYEYDGSEVTLISHEDEFGAGVQMLYYTAPANQPPIASFTYSPESPFSGDIVSFDASGSYDPEGQQLSYVWVFRDDFGYVETATGCNVTHRFRGATGEPKTYTVTLVVEDDEGNTNATSICVNVEPLTKVVPTSEGCLDDVSCWMRVSYNWLGIDEVSEKDAYCISEVTSYCGGVIGAYQLFILRYVEPPPSWPKVIWHIALPALPIVKTYNVTRYDPSIWQKYWGTPCEPAEFSTPEGTFTGIGVTERDLFAIVASGTAGFPLTYLDIGMTRFDPDSPVQHLKQEELEEIEELKDMLGLLNMIIGLIGSPADLRAYDSEGRVTGLVNGEAREEIPYSFYNDGTVVIFCPSDSYRYEVVGTDAGTYGLGVTSVRDGEVDNLAATDIPTTSGAVHQYTIDWDALSEGGAGVTIKKDSDGDGEFEETIVTSQPNTPSNSAPLNHAATVSTETDLSWSGGDPDVEDIVTYSVYFGTNSTPLLTETIGPYAANQTSIGYSPGTLSYSTKYYWKIVARDNHGVTKEGPVWDFTTQTEAGRKGDFDGDGVINIFDFVLFAAAYGSELGDDNYNPIGDFNNDDHIDIFDFVDFAAVYGT